MATSKSTAKAKPLTEPLNRAALLTRLSDATSLPKAKVREVLDELTGAIEASVAKKGCGTFTLPGFLKITAVAVPAKPKRKGIDPFTKQERVFAAKPATVKVKVRALKRLKDAAL